jgi:hypothetical protein
MSTVEIHSRNHCQTPVEYNGNIIEVDRNMKHLLIAIWSKNISTVYSCEGSDGGYAWITFCGIKNANMFLHNISFSIKTWKIRSYKIVDNILHGYFTTLNKKTKEIIINDCSEEEKQNLVIAISFPNRHISKLTDEINKT